uniref:Protein kinase domain-containing protein n=1 Tax=Meloidogyne enterolobii TaxID=390850 RepID=A0A6V7WYP7_MELEN|nr:unnamed protein product [Meloidogyne enterolobii]
MLPRSEAFKLLSNDGDFLLRLSKPDGTEKIILSTIQKGSEFNFVIKYFKKLTIITTQTIEDLMNQQLKCSKKNLIQHLTLTTPINRHPWELTKQSLKFGIVLGSGAFGVVRKAELNGNKVAVKEQNESFKLLQEAILMQKLQHQNIVKFIGITLDALPFMLVMELCLNGSLCDYLQLNYTDTGTKIKMCLDVASGLAHMHNKNIIHVDVAARNCLYSNNQVKIADFGLSRILPMGVVFVNILANENLPLRYLAPQTYQNKVLGKTTDVWSYGVMTWEIFANCQTPPYANNTNSQVKNQILSGKILEFNSSTPKEFSQFVINKIFNKNVTERASMNEVVLAIENMIKDRVKTTNKEKKGKKRG